MRRSLKKYLQTESVADMHQFRVQVKKLRAFITLAESTEKHANLKRTFKPVKKLFSKAGEIRTADLNIEISRSHSPKPQLIAQQIKQRDEAIAAFKPFAQKQLNKLKSVKRRLHKQIKPISKLHINMFYSENLRQLNERFSQMQFDESLHTSRKQLKVLLYDHQLTASVLNTPLNTKYIDQVQEVIGDWHDNEDAKALFKKEQLPLTAINQKALNLQALIKSVVADLYNKATTVNDVALPQVS